MFVSYATDMPTALASEMFSCESDTEDFTSTVSNETVLSVYWTTERVYSYCFETVLYFIVNVPSPRLKVETIMFPFLIEVFGAIDGFKTL